jgi:Phage Mu protein F like protein/ADP-ribosyltransferase exoenzyme
VVSPPNHNDDQFSNRVTSLSQLIRRVWRIIAKSAFSTLSAQGSVTLSDASVVRAGWADQLGAAVLGHIRDTYVDGAGFIAQATESDTDELIGEDHVDAYISQARNRLVGVGDDVWQDVRAQIQLGLQSGESVTDIAQRVKNVSQVSTARALTIARTETHAAYEAGSHAQALFVDPNATKTWLATDDDQTRPSHQAADGQTVKISEQFTVGEVSLNFPGDPLGGPNEIIQCRCSVAYSFADSTTADDTSDVTQDDLALVSAAKKWNPSAHPRGNDGKFIKKGAVADLLSKKKPLISDVTDAAADLTTETWNKLTPEQKSYLVDSLKKLPIGTMKEKAYKNFAKAAGASPIKVSVDTVDAPIVKTSKNLNDVDLSAYKTNEVIAHDPSTGDVIEKSGSTSISFLDEDGAEIDSIIVGPYSGTIEDFVQGNSTSSVDKWKISLPGEKTTILAKSTAEATKKTAPKPVTTKIPAGLKGKPGDPAKVTTGVIWGKHTAGDVILEAGDEIDTYVEWDGKKYLHVVQGEHVASWTKKDAYAQLKGDTHWVIPDSSDIPTEDKISNVSKTAWQKQWDKGLITTEEFEAEFGEKPVGADNSSTDAPTLEGIVNGMMQAETQDDWKALQEQAAKLPPPAKTTTTSPVKNILLEDAEDSFVNPSETVALVTMLDMNDMPKLSDTQKKNISKQLEIAQVDNFPGHAEAQSKWKALLSVELGSEVTSTNIQSDVSGNPLGVNDFVDIINDSYKLKSGDIVAVSSSGTSRITWSELNNAFMIEELIDGEWIDIDQYSFDDDSGSDNESIVSDMLFSYDTELWLKPSDADVADLKGNQVTAPIFTNKNVITNWPGVFTGKHATDSTVAVSSDGVHEITKGYSKGVFYVMKTSPATGKQSTIATILWPDDKITSTLQGISNTWVVPPKKDVPLPSAQKLAESDLAKPTISNIFTKALADAQDNDVVAVGTLANMPNAKFRLVMLDQDDFGDAKLELQTLPATHTGSDEVWSSLGNYAGSDAFNGEWGATPVFEWKWADEQVDSFNPYGTSKPKSTGPGPLDTPIPTKQQTTTSPGVTPTVPTVKTVENGEDTTNIPQYVKTHFKGILKSNGNVGYWSKSEKIWDALKEIQKEYPDPQNPGNSLYTPAQILKSLDELTNTQVPNPYITKINKWAGTAKGSAYVKGAGSANPLGISTEKSPTEIAKTVWSNGFKLPKNAVLFTGTSPASGLPYQILNKTASGDSEPLFYIQYKQNGNWVSTGAVVNAADLADVIVKFDLKPTPKSSVPLPQTSVPSPTSSPTPTPPDVSQVAQILDGGTGGIDNLTDQQKQTVYGEFKKIPSTYLDSPDKDIFIALKHISSNNGMSLLQGLQIIDEVGAKKVNAPNAYLFQKKIQKWLQTPQGAAVALGQPVPKPKRPDFSPGVSTAEIPSFEASSAFKYNTVSPSQANADWAKSVAKYGDWSGVQRSGLKAYTGGIYYSINGYLYGEYDSISPTNEKAMVNAQKGMRPSTSPMLLHRGVGYDGVGDSINHADLLSKVGQVWRSDGFSSTSVGGHAAFSGKQVIMEIEAPPGTPMAWLKPISNFSGENEMLLAAGTNYKIISVTKKGHQSIVRVRVVPDEETS